MKQLIKNIAMSCGLEIRRYSPTTFDTKRVSLSPGNGSRGNVLLSYILEPFLSNGSGPVSSSHTNHWESLQIARTFLDLGYSVDVIDFRNKTFVPQKGYDVFIDARWNLERLAPLLNEDCLKVMHIDTAHLLFHNAAESSRLLMLQQRKGITLRPRRFEMPHLGIEHADCATILGNEFTMKTYRYAGKPLYPIPISTPVLFDWNERKDFDACRKNFLWFGSGGLVHKGLDLVLDTFKELPGYHLFICGPVQKEKDFEGAYFTELYQTSNIHTIGWVDIAGPQFAEILNQCIGLIYPSCAEGQSGGVVTCLHAGLIPVVSYESGVDIDDFGIILKECSLEEIRNSVGEISDLPATELGRMARKAWEFARANHTREKFAQEYRKAAIEILKTHMRER